MSTEFVYIVSEGNYSDYHIVAVFLTKEEANAFAYELSAGDEYKPSWAHSTVEVEEYRIGRGKYDEGMGYNVAMNRKGELYIVQPVPLSKLRAPDEYIRADDGGRSHWHASGETVEAARRVCDAMRRQAIAEGRVV